MSKKISILGTGWLGLPLAKALHKEKYHIKGSTTSTDKLEYLKNEGIDPYQVALLENDLTGDIKGFLQESAILIINVPPGLRRNPESNFVSKIKRLIPYIEQSSVQKLLFIGSTSVFAEHEGFPVVTAETIPNATSNAGKQLIETEQLLLKNENFDTTILRFAGLFDARRHPSTMLSKRKNIKNPLAPVNLIHREDCIGIIQKIIATDHWNVIFNASYPDHPEKATYYANICKEMGLSTPDYDFESVSKGKVIDTDKVSKILGYIFRKNLNSL